MCRDMCPELVPALRELVQWGGSSVPAECGQALRALGKLSAATVWCFIVTVWARAQALSCSVYFQKEFSVKTQRHESQN